jgi:hypothetical protein
MLRTVAQMQRLPDPETFVQSQQVTVWHGELVVHDQHPWPDQVVSRWHPPPQVVPLQVQRLEQLWPQHGEGPQCAGHPQPPDCVQFPTTSVRAPAGAARTREYATP